MELVVKNPPANAGDTRDLGSITGPGRSSGEGHGNQLQNSCLENPMDRGVWWATIQRVPKSRTQLKRQHAHTPPEHSPVRCESGIFGPVSSSLRFPVCGSTWGGGCLSLNQ